MENKKESAGSNDKDQAGVGRRDFITKTAIIAAGLTVGQVSWGDSAHR